MPTTHQWIHSHVSIKGRTRNYSWISGTPFYIEAPLITCGKFIDNLHDNTNKNSLHEKRYICLYPFLNSLSKEIIQIFLFYSNKFLESIKNTIYDACVFIPCLRNYCILFVTNIGIVITSPPWTLLFGFQQRILLSFPQLRSRSESCGHQAISNTPLKKSLTRLDLCRLSCLLWYYVPCYCH